MKYAVYTLGCKVNQYETQAIETMLKDRGFEPVEEHADVILVNTCAVTAESGRKSRQAIRRLMQKHPGALTAVCGCFSQLEPEAVKELGADIVFGSGEKEKLVEAIVARFPVTEIDDPFRRMTFEPLPAGAAAGRTRAMLKVEDGCVNFCAYCIIPYARGAVRSLPLEAAVAQAVGLRERGYREIVVTGIELSSWGQDLKTCQGPAELIGAICAAVPEVRIRLGSLEPRTVTKSFCETLSGYSNLCPQFHLSLQSGCDETLRRMRRKYDTGRFLMSCRLLRETFPDCAVTTDLIVGFPGETEEEFARTLAFLREAAFSAMHIFPYSRREGTPAAAMPNQIPNGEKASRAARAGAVERELRQAYRERFLGRTMEVLFEQAPKGRAMHGFTENYIRVELPPASDNHLLDNQIRRVCLGGFNRDQSALQVTLCS